jgi:hypothetical protein
VWHQDREDAARALALGQESDRVGRHVAHRAMTRVALETPGRPTWSGDRLNAAAIRLEHDHHLDLVAVWPHLWLILPETTRAEITAARQALTRAISLTAWALLYLVLTVWWWPAALIALGLAVAGWWRIRAATDTYALLLEAATRLHAGDLARSVGLEFTGPLTEEVGDALTILLSPSPPIRSAG